MSEGDVCEVLFDWEPQNSDELALLRGDIVRVTHQDESGWWFGVLLSTGQEGMFPRNYVKLRSPDMPPPAPKRPSNLKPQESGKTQVSVKSSPEKTATSSNAATLSSVAAAAPTPSASSVEAAVASNTASVDEVDWGSSEIEEELMRRNRFSIKSLDAFDSLMNSGVCVEIISSPNKHESFVQPGMYASLQCKVYLYFIFQ
jgi:hypothetical protein